ncbi:MAG: tetratricopeptide repeat protein [Patescibacteria group bacterium]|nr:tetratricopeptide repeat protein [Patescibacteria group bacterium]
MDDSSASLKQRAITAALSANWEEALAINQEILNSEPNNVDALNRIARAYFELGDFKLSKKNYQESLKIDPYNQIAYKFIKRIEACAKKGVKLPNGKNGKNHSILETISNLSDLFIEEPGKTKVVNLLKVAEPKKLSFLSPGTPVLLVLRNRCIAVTDQNSDYLGVLPDDLSHQLTRLINGGNKYQALIKTVKINAIAILIREIYRSTRFRNQPSFLENSGETFSYSSDNIYFGDTEDSSEDTENEEES